MPKAYALELLKSLRILRQIFPQLQIHIDAQIKIYEERYENQ